MQWGLEKIRKNKQPAQLAALEKQLVEKYNKFALKNNDLAGIDILSKKKEYKKTRLAKRTFRDEIARSNRKIGNLLFKWHEKTYLDSISCFDKFSDTDKKIVKTEKPETTKQQNTYNCKILTDQLNTFLQHCNKLISLWKIQLNHANNPSSLQKNKLKLKEEFNKFSTFSQTLPQPL
jgi:hypothetical protein